MTTTPTTSPPIGKSAADLGVTFGGSAKTGHTVSMRDDALSDVFGVDDRDQAAALMAHLLRVLKPQEAGDGGASADERHFVLSIVRDLGPRDAVERMLAVQMAATHIAIIRAGCSRAHAENLLQFEAHTAAYTKLARTFAAQVEALRKHRTGGKQTVVVQHQHVTVEDGGRAIVGHVQAGAGDRGVGQP